MPERIPIDRAEVVKLRRNGRSWPEVADAVGCGLTTIKRRASEWGLADPTEQQEKAARSAGKIAVARWEAHRAEHANSAGAVASRILIKLDKLIPSIGTPVRDGKGQVIAPAQLAGMDAFRLARTYEILVKSAQLLSGGVTERTESLDAESFDAEYDRLVRELRDNPTSVDS